MPATWQEGATSPPIRFELTQDGSPYDLTGKTLKFRFAKAGQTATFERDCTIDDPPTDGKAHLDWQAGDLDVSGEYEGQLILVEGSTEEPLAVFEVIVARTIPEPAV